jgi:signal transduction protein with GAF and PtsI domain
MTIEQIDGINPNAVGWMAIVGMANKAVNGEIIILDGDGEEVIIDSSDDAYLEYGDDVNIDRWDRDEFGPIVAYDIDKMIEILAKDGSRFR